MLNFTQEQLKAAKAAKTPEELLAMAKDAGIEITQEQAAAFLNPPIGELSDEELENVAGGGCGGTDYEIVTLSPCPTCGSTTYKRYIDGVQCAGCGKWC